MFLVSSHKHNGIIIHSTRQHYIISFVCPCLDLFVKESTIENNII